jgi:hypothetical protein
VFGGGRYPGDEAPHRSGWLRPAPSAHHRDQRFNAAAMDWLAAVKMRRLYSGEAGRPLCGEPVCRRRHQGREPPSAKVCRCFQDLRHHLGDRLAPERRDHYEQFLDAALRVLARYYSHRNLTVVHGDAHDFFLPGLTVTISDFSIEIPGASLSEPPPPPGVIEFMASTIQTRRQIRGYSVDVLPIII